MDRSGQSSARRAAPGGHAELLAPGSVHWEVGNAFSALLKRSRLGLPEVQAAPAAYGWIPIRFVDVDLAGALELANRFGLYAYGAYLMACARLGRDEILEAIREGRRPV